MNNQNQTVDWIGVCLVAFFFILLSYAGYLSYKSIDWDVLKRMENQKLILPTPLPLPSPTTPASTPEN